MHSVPNPSIKDFFYDLFSKFLLSKFFQSFSDEYKLRGDQFLWSVKILKVATPRIYFYKIILRLKTLIHMFEILIHVWGIPKKSMKTELQWILMTPQTHW